ncbi:MAG: immunoglobulin domain-containing protein [Opitutaceae bacterium]|nr:immunoglobulin domain-containing protein [Opitutaceae bacterium]
MTEPTGVTAYVGEPATLTTVLDGTAPISVQWYKNTVAIGGATTPTFTVTAAAEGDAGVYYLVATNAFGTATSQPVAIFVTKRPQTITFAPATTTVVAGSGVVLNATASSGLTVTYTLVSGAATLNGNVLTGSGGNVVVRAAQAGNTTIAAATSVEVTFNFVSGSLSPFITSPPIDQTVTAGGSATFRGTAIGNPAPTYLWQKDGVAIPGATSPTLTLAATTLADAGRYTLTATNASGTATASATLTVRAAPVITTGPASQAVFAGDRVSLTVAVSGFPAPTYQWRRNGTVVAGATGATLTLPSATATDAGDYTVTVTNALGTVTSEPATLSVTLRDFSGVYFGQFGGTDGEFVLLVRADRTAVFLGTLPARQTGLAVTNLRVDLAGGFSLATTTLGGATPQAVTLRGTLDEATGALSGTLAELGVTLAGTRSERTGTATTLAGSYPLALLGSAAGNGLAVVAPNGQVFVLTAAGTAPDSARGVLDAAGRLIATTSTQAALDFVFAGGTVRGTVRTPTGTTGTVAGVIDALAGTEHLANLSIRTTTSPGAGTLITGFVVAGTAAKQVLIRAAGPALAGAPFNVAGALDDPTIQVFRGTTVVGQNDDWGAPAANAAAITAAATRAGAFPFRAGSADAAILSTLTPGAYTVVVAGGTGNVLAEIYEVLQNNEAPGARRLVNVSARGVVSPAAPFISGFVISGPGPQRVLIRGIGPTLAGAPFNVAGALPNPQLALFRGATVVKSNDDWFRDPEAALIREASVRAGAFALGNASLDAAMLLYLEPGAYTVQVSPPANANAANSTGLVLIEVYESAP